MSLNVLICCRVNLYAEGLQKLLEEDSGLSVLGISHTDTDISKLMQYGPDVIVADLPSCEKILSSQFNTKGKKTLLIDETNDISAEQIKKMIANGLGGILAMDVDSRILQKAIRKLHDGELWFDRHTIHDVLSQGEEEKEEIHLTKKEKEILSHICSGFSNKEIAKKMFISEQTVKSHCNHLFKKFGVRSRLKLAISAPECLTENQKKNVSRW